jgi:predicted ATPase
VLMVFEDAHWADPTSLEAFGRLVDRIQTLRVLLLEPISKLLTAIDRL